MRYICSFVLIIGLGLIVDTMPASAEPTACLTAFSTVKIRENNCRRFERPFDLAELVEVVEQTECPCFDLNTLRTIPLEEERIKTELELAVLAPAPDESELFCLDTPEGTAVGRTSDFDNNKTALVVRARSTTILAAAGKESFVGGTDEAEKLVVDNGNGETYLCLLDEDMRLPRERLGQILADEANRCRELIRSYAGLLDVECTDALPEPDPKNEF